jgi:apolipoprotein N-acyltransferase
MTIDLDHRAWRIAAAVLSGALVCLGRGLEPVWWAMWLAPIPLLIAAFRAGPREVWLLAGLASVIGSATTVAFYAMLLGVVGAAAIMALSAVVNGIVVATTRAIVRGSPHWLNALVFPTLLAAFDTVLIATSPHGAQGGLANSQAQALPVIQIASLAGTAGIVFAVGLFGSTVAIACHHGRSIAKPWLACGLPGAVLAAVLGFGIARLALSPDAPVVRVGLIAIDRASPPPRNPISPEDATWRAYAAAVPGVARLGAKIVVLPENVAGVDGAAEDRVHALLARAAQDSGVYLLVGVGLLGGDPATNSAWMFAPDGSEIAGYAKQHLIPGLEARFTAGSDAVVRDIDGARFGIAICKDMDFPALSRRYAAEGVEAMLVPAWDFIVDGWSHAGVTLLRGVESGFSIVRSARGGLLTVTDRYGRIVAAKPSSSAAEASLVVDAPLGPGVRTLYAHVGDLLGWLCVLAGGGIVVRLLYRFLMTRPRRQSRLAMSH